MPKGVPLEPGQQHLAVHVEDHPLDYATFEGEIPKGQYGAGTVEIWDTAPTSSSRGRRDGGLTVRLARQAARRDVDARPGAALRRAEELADHPQARRTAPRRRAARREYAPMLATLEDERAAARRRTGCSRSSGTATATSRACAGGEAELAHAATTRPAPSASPTVAKELAEGAEDARLRRSTARSARSTRRAARASRRCSREAGHAARLLRLRPARAGRRAARRPAAHERRERLEQLLDRRNRTVRLSETFDDGEALFEAAKEQGLEGIMAKRPDSRYLPGKRIARLAQDQDARPRRSS